MKKIIEEIEKIRRELKPSLVRKQEQLKGIAWLLGLEAVSGLTKHRRGALMKEVRKKYK